MTKAPELFQLTRTIRMYNIDILYEPLHKKTNKMLGRKQRRRSDSR